MKEDYEDGQCHLCREITKVRWKNIYWIGSEGLNVCHSCEMKIVNFVRELSRKYQLEKKAKILRERARKKRICKYCKKEMESGQGNFCPDCHRFQ